MYCKHIALHEIHYEIHIISNVHSREIELLKFYLKFLDINVIVMLNIT